MEPLTAATIATLAFTKFLEGSAGKAAEKFTDAAIAKMDDLRKRIWATLIGREPELKQTAQEIEQSRQVTPEQIDEITAYLQIAMKRNRSLVGELMSR